MTPNTSTDPSAQLEFQKLAASQGLTTTQLTANVVVGCAASIMMWRSARRGDAARTVAWASILLRMQMQRGHRTLHTQLKKFFTP